MNRVPLPGVDVGIHHRHRRRTSIRIMSPSHGSLVRDVEPGKGATHPAIVHRHYFLFDLISASSWHLGEVKGWNQE